ncbi:MAG: DUF3616 domain-containing protein [Verrucomicrobiae bacterium]|nr:DUF3616 domain-containing protein [Verrucomicrobiae bacterium]
MKIVPSSVSACTGSILGLCGLLTIGCADAQSPPKKLEEKSKWSIERAAGQWRIIGNLAAPANISAIASLNGDQFLIGSDDLMFAQYGTIDRESRTLRITGDVALLGGKGDDEIDIEGITSAQRDRQYFVTGSHSLTKKGNMNKERRSVFRVNVSASGAITRKIDRATLRDVIERDSILNPFWEKAQQEGGINVEGLAWKNGSLFFGLRSPSIDANALVVQVSASQLFNKGKVSHQLHRLPLGRGLGIREMVAIAEGFLIVAGNAGDEPTREYPIPRDYIKDRAYDIFFWNGVDQTDWLTRLPRRSGRPEAILVLDDSEARTELLILWDGIVGGAPQHFVLSKT